MSDKLNILAVPASTQTANTLRQLLGALPDLQAKVLPAGSGSAGAAAPTADVLLYELPALGLDGLAPLLAQLREDIVVFVIGTLDDPALLRSLMQMGVRDVLHEPLDPAELQEKLARVHSEKRSQAPADAGSTVVAFCNAYGGSGATLLAANTATTLARQYGARVALLDFDLQFGKTAHILDLKPQGHMLDALRDAARLDPVFLKALMCEHESGVQVLAAPPTLAPSEVATAAVGKVIATAATRHDFVILDLPRLVNEWTLEAMSRCDTVLLLTQNTLGAMRDTRRLLDYLTGDGALPAERLEVVNSRAMSRLPSTSIAQMKKTLGRERLHRVRNDYAAALAAEDQGLPLFRAAPQSALTQDSNRLAGHIWRLRHPDATRAPEKPPRWFDRLLGHPVQASPVS